MIARRSTHTRSTGAQALLTLVAVVLAVAALGVAAGVAAAPASAATSADYFFISSFGPTYATGDYFGEFGAGPNGIATDSAGNVYVTIPEGFVKYYANGSLACVYKGDNGYTAGNSYGLDVDTSGNVYYADRTNHCIAKLHPSSNGVNGNSYNLVSLTGKNGADWLWVPGGGGNANIGTGDGEFNFPNDVAVDGHYLWVTDTLNNRIQKFETATGDNTLSFVGKWGRNGGDGTSGSGDGEFNHPRGIDAQGGVSGHVFVGDDYNHRVQELTNAGAFVGKFGSTTASDPLYLYSAIGVDVDAQGDVYVTDLGDATSWVGKFHSTSGVWSRVTRIGGFGSSDAQFHYPWSSVVAPNGSLYVTDTQNNLLKKFARDATPPTVAPAGFPAGWTNNVGHPEFLASDPVVAGQYTSGGVSIRYSKTGGAPWTSYLEPFASMDFVEGDNTLTYFATDAVGNASALAAVHVYYDRTAPVTTPSGVSATWSNTNASVTLAPGNDGLSAIASTQYRLQGAPAWTAYSGPFTVSAEGTSVYEFRSTDAAGNAEATKTLTVRIDKTAPITTDPGLASGWSKTDVPVLLLANSDGLSPIVTQYRLLGAANWSTYATPFTVSTEGTTTWEYRSTDAAGNAETARSLIVSIDKTAPVTVVTGIPTGWTKTSPTAAFSPVDTVAGVAAVSGVASTAYSTDGGVTWTPGLSAQMATQGITTLLVRSTDVAGNVEDPKTVTAHVDGTAPVPKALANRSVKRNKTVKMPFKVVDVPGAQVKVTIKIYKGSRLKKTLKVGVKAVNVGLAYSYRCKLAKGKYTWKVYATDLAGNTQAKPASRTLKVK